MRTPRRLATSILLLSLLVTLFPSAFASSIGHGKVPGCHPHHPQKASYPVSYECCRSHGQSAAVTQPAGSNIALPQNSVVGVTAIPLVESIGSTSSEPRSHFPPGIVSLRV